MSSLTTMQAAVSSVNCGLKLNPSFEKNSMDFLRFFTGRFTKICLVATFLSFANLKSIHQRMSDGKIASRACCRLEYIGCNYYSARVHHSESYSDGLVDIQRLNRFSHQTSTPANSKPVTCLAEGAFPKRQDLRGPDAEHDCGAAVFVVKRAVAHFILPLSVPFPSPGLREAFERVIIRELDGVALNHDVYSCVPVVAAGCQNYVRIATQVERLSLRSDGAEVDGFVEPDGNERSNVRPTIGPYRRDPK